MRIAQLNHNQKDYHHKSITVAGAVRATYNKPFPYFLIEDESGTLVCRPNGPLPAVNEHLTITGDFVLATPQKCTVELAMLNETEREYVLHPTDNCHLAGCEFATQLAA